jgi:hypothetical protein
MVRKLGASYNTNTNPITKDSKLDSIQNLQMNLSQIFSSIYNKREFEKAKEFLISNLENIFKYYTLQINYPHQN